MLTRNKSIRKFYSSALFNLIREDFSDQGVFYFLWLLSDFLSPVGMKLILNYVSKKNERAGIEQSEQEHSGLLNNSRMTNLSLVFAVLAMSLGPLFSSSMVAHGAHRAKRITIR